MRALHVIPSVAARYGGPSTAIAPMCRALADRGLETMVLTTSADGPGRLDVPIGTPTTWQGVPALFFERNFSESFKYSRGLSRWLREHVAEYDIVHIHALMSHACLSAASAGRRAGVPYVVRPLGTLAAWSLGQKAYKKRLLLLLGARAAVRHAAAIQCTSEDERRGIERDFPDAHPLVIPLGIDAAALTAPQASWTERHARPSVLVMSRLHPKKNLEALMKAFAAATAVPALAGWRLVVAGAGDASYVAALEALGHELGLGARVEFVGWVDGDRKAALIRQASIFALASLHENFGVSLLEALAAGVPGLVSRHVELADEVRAAGAGWIVDADVDSLRDGFEAALGNPPALEARGRAARHLAERFAWPDIATRIVDMYQGCIEARPA